MSISLFLLIFQSAYVAPGSSPEHWTTRTFIFGGITMLVVFAFAYMAWDRLLAGVRQNPVQRILVYAAEAGTAIVLSVVASYFDIFKKTTYKPTSDYHPDWHVVFWACIWAALVAFYAVAKLCAIWTKESEDFKSKKLTDDLEKETAAKTALDRQRTLLVKITSFAKVLVGKKIERFCTLRNKDKITVAQLVEQLSPTLQIQLILKLIHEFFKPHEQDGAIVRLALWMHDSSKQADRLSIAYSWDGEKENCFSNQSTDRMKLVDYYGARSEVVKCYQSPARTIKIIPNCVAAAARDEFVFFYPEQRDKIGNMVLYKHVFKEQPSAVVLLLVSSRADHFLEPDADEIRQFLDEMLTRVEMESIVLEMTRRVA